VSSGEDDDFSPLIVSSILYKQRYVIILNRNFRRQEFFKTAVQEVYSTLYRAAK
jgi:hypothetical protein